MKTFALGVYRGIGVILASMLFSSLHSAAQSEGQALHVFVGKSVVINVQAPVTRILSSNPAVIETLATSPTQIVVEGKTAGSSSLIFWDSTGHSQMLDVTVDVNVAYL
jgi:pilus assembly protein CpaC